MGDYLDSLSAFVADTCFGELPDDAVAAVKDVTLDTIGAIIAGSWQEQSIDSHNVFSYSLPIMGITL